MPEESQPLATPPPEPTDARFSMRAMLIVTAAVAVLAAVGGAFIRKYPPDAQTRILALWTAWLAITVGGNSCLFYLRKRAEKQAGRTLLKLRLSNHPTQSRALLWYVIAWPPLIVLMLYFASDSIADLSVRRGALLWAMNCGLPIVGSIVAASNILPFLLWQYQVRLCEFGILWDRKFLPWDHLIQYEWTSGHGESLVLHSVDEQNRRPWLTIAVPQQDHDSVLSILEEKVCKFQTRPTGMLTIGIGQVPISVLLKTTSYRWHLPAVFTGIILGLSLICLAWRNAGNVPMFDESILAAFCLYCFVGPWRWHSVGSRAGAPMIRLFARRDWLGLATAFAAALGIYILGSRYGWSSAWLAYAAGIAFCFLTLKVFSYFVLTQLDMRQNGVVVRGALYWPWEKLRLVTWDCDGGGRLVLQRRWRRIVAIVPAEQRAAVDAVLKEKLGANAIPTSGAAVDLPDPKRENDES